MWQDFGTVKVQDNEVLIKKSFNPGVGIMPGSSSPEPGKVEFVDSGQIHMPEGVNTKGAPLPDEKDNKCLKCADEIVSSPENSTIQKYKNY